MAPPGRREARRRASFPGWAVAALFAVAAAVSATIFGFGFAPEAHHQEAAGEHAEAVEEDGGEAGPEEEEPTHAADEKEEAERAAAGVIASAILISLAGVALVPLTLMSARRGRIGLAEGSRGEPALAAVGAAPVVAALLSIGAATVHFAVIAQHFDEWWLTGMFFLTIAVFQLGWGLLVLLRPSALVYLAGAVVNALIVLTWIVSGRPVCRSDPRPARRRLWASPTRCPRRSRSRSWSSSSSSWPTGQLDSRPGILRVRRVWPPPPWSHRSPLWHS